MSVNYFSVLSPVQVLDSGTFTRTSTATYIDADGLLKTAAANVPRFSYDPATLEPVGALMEAAVTNWAAHSEDFGFAVWAKSGVAVDANVAVAPDGNMTADKLRDDATTGLHTITQINLAQDAGQPFCGSIYVKSAGDGRLLHLRVDDTGSLADVVFDPDTGTVVSSAGGFKVGSGFEALRDGWYRVWVAAKNNSGGVKLQAQLRDAVAGDNYTGTNTKGLYIWGSQLEAGSNPSSYIPAPFAATSRTADNNSLFLLSNVAEPATGVDADPAAWNASVIYPVGMQASRIVAGTRHEVYQRLIAGSTATAPEDDTTNWVKVGPTNRWRMFDLANETQTSRANEIVVVLKPGTLINCLALDNLDADWVRVFVEGTSYDVTVDLRDRTVLNWYDYFFNVFRFKTSALFENLPPLFNRQITVIIHKVNGGTAKCGTLALGFARRIGIPQYGASIGIIDYSTKSTDLFGSTTVIQRPFSKRMNIEVLIDNRELDAIHSLLSSLRATPSVWIGVSGVYSSMIVYGYYRSFDIVIPYPTQSRCNFEIEGLT